MKPPVRVSSGSYLVWFRADRPRREIQAYWRETHARIAGKISAMNEYLQHHFSDTDHGFWPAPDGVATEIPKDWRIDGLTEVRIRSFWAGLKSTLFEMRDIARDEQNIFDRVLAKLTPSGGGRWWTGPYQPGIGFRAILLIRVRHEMKGASFRCFIEEELAPAILSAGVMELRTHVFQPGSRFLHRTPAVRHDEPANRNYAGAIIIGAHDRESFDQLIESPPIKATYSTQFRHCLAIHAYAVEGTYPIVLNDRPLVV
jgi:hypothetical protein